MKTRNKALLMALCAVLLVVASVMGTVAYLTDVEKVTNTFTVGNVQIKLDEAVYGGEGRTEEGNAYKLMPGQTYTKDPTVHIVEGSDESYVRMIVKVTNYSDLLAAFPADKKDADDNLVYGDWYANGNLLLQYLVGGWDKNVWVSTNVISVEDNVATYEFRYVDKVSGPADDNNAETTLVKDLPALFNTINVPGTIENTELAKLANVQIIVEAHAIQAEGFADAAAAWGAWSN